MPNFDAPMYGNPMGPNQQYLTHPSFDNPEQFLATLKDVLPRANPDRPNGVTKEDLIEFSYNGDNDKDRAAAAIAAQHWDALRNMPHAFWLHNPSADKPVISRQEIYFDQILASGSTDRDIERLHSEDMTKLMESSVFAVGSGIVAAANLEIPPIAGVAGASAIAGGAAAIAVGVDALHIKSAVHNSEIEAQRTLNNWNEINGRFYGTGNLTDRYPMPPEK